MSYAFLKHARLTLPTYALLAASFIIFPGFQAKAIETVAREAVMIDMQTGTVIFEKNPTASMPPASMSKLMTAYMVFERLRDGRLSLEDTFSVSENAWRKGGTTSGSSTMFLEPGKRIRVEDLLRGIIVQSGNDACIVVAEAISGSEEAFAAEMTAKARQLGMTGSTFTNATGWPDENHRMTPMDLATLAKKIIQNFPDYYHYYSEKSFVFNGIKQSNRNPLLYKDMGADGLKTGHTEESGYGLTSSAMRGDRRLILVLNGMPSKNDRAQESERLLEWGFREFDNYALLKAGEKIEDAAVWLGKDATVPLIVENDLTLTLPKKSRRDMKVVVNYDGPLPAPIIKGTRLATLTFSAPGTTSIEIPLVAANDVEQLGLVGRLMAAIKSIIWGGSS